MVGQWGGKNPSPSLLSSIKRETRFLPIEKGMGGEGNAMPAAAVSAEGRRRARVVFDRTLTMRDKGLKLFRPGLFLRKKKKKNNRKIQRRAGGKRGGKKGRRCSPQLPGRKKEEGGERRFSS